MAFALRDMRSVIVHCDDDILRAGFAVVELFPLPTVILTACYAIPTCPARVNETNGDVSMADGDATPLQDATSKYGWLVGEELVNAQKEIGWENNLEIKWPFRSTKEADDCDGREFVLAHLLGLLGINISTNHSPLLLIPPPTPTFPLSTQALYTQLAFESLNTPMFSMLPAPLSALYALGVTTGIVIHIGRSQSIVFAVTDSIIRWECSATANIGQADCEEFFEQLLLNDELLEQELRNASGSESLEPEEKRRFVREVATVIWTECTGDDIEVPVVDTGVAEAIGVQATGDDDSFDVAKKLVGDNAPVTTTHSHKNKRQQAQALAAANKAAAAAVEAAQQSLADTIVINIPSLPEKEIQLGPVRHRICEPLLKGTKPGGDTVWEAAGRAVENASLSIGEKLSLWDGVCVIGETARIKSFAPSFLTYLSPYLLSSSELSSDCQASKARLLNIPEYFANYKKSTTELAPFLGGMLVAKVAFTEASGKHSVSKVDYNTRGPEIAYTVLGEDR
nr:RNA polymerase II transcription factor [Cryptococcus depauperatus CBS 7855]